MLAAFANSFGLGFATDAQVIVSSDARIRAVSAENVRLILARDYWWPAPTDVLYRPVTLLSYLFNYALLGNGPNAAGYHVVNLLLHVLNALLVFALCRRLFPKILPAFFAAALWAVHPVNTESVTNVSGRADLLAAAGVLGGLMLYLHARDWTGRRAPAGVAGVFALAAVGVFSKENAAVLAGLMLLWDSLDPAGLLREWKRRVPFYAAAGTALIVLFVVRNRIFSARPWPLQPYINNPLILADFWTARFTAIKVIGLQLWLMLCPLRLAYDRSYHQIAMSGAGDLAAWCALAAVIAILAGALVLYRRQPTLFFGVGFLAVALLPTANLIVLIGSIFAERFLYLPSVGFAIALVALVSRLEEKTARVILAAALMLFAGRTFARNIDWYDNLTLARADVSVSTDSSVAHDLLARALFIHDSRANLDGAIQEGEAAWRIVRDLPVEYIPADTLRHLGLYYTTKGDQGGGESWYRKAVEILLRGRDAERAAVGRYERDQAAHGRLPGPRIGLASLYVNLATAYTRLGEHAAAIEALRDGKSEDPTNLEFYPALSREYLAVHDTPRAAATLLEMASLSGSPPETIVTLRQAFAEMPGGDCAVAGVSINYGCPAVRQQMCVALEDLAQGFEAARRPEQSQAQRERAAREFECSR